MFGHLVKEIYFIHFFFQVGGSLQLTVKPRLVGRLNRPEFPSLDTGQPIVRLLDQNSVGSVIYTLGVPSF